jgi:hypothetical protein
MLNFETAELTQPTQWVPPMNAAAAISAINFPDGSFCS